MPVLAEDKGPNAVVTLVDAISKETIGDVFIEMKLNEEINYYFLEEDEILKINLEDGEYEVEIVIDDPNTEGIDYYTESYLDVQENLAKVIYLYPVGSLSGFVKDNLDNVISGADIKFECNRVFNLDYPEITDQFGSFSLRFVPIGNCKIHGSFEGETGMTEVEIEKGSLSTLDIKLNTGLIRNNSSLGAYLISLGLIILIMAGIIGLFLMKNRKKTSKKKEAKKEKSSDKKIGQRGEDILKTLRKNERMIVEYLLDTKGPSHLSKIHYKTGISKGALFRNIKSLEQKNIIETYSEGRVKKIKLSEWFTEK